MKRSILILLACFVCVVLHAQNNIAVKSFRALPTDMTASSLQGKRIDQNGEVAALIKVVTTELGFIFEGGTLGIVDTKQQTGEIWVWVPRGLRKITLKHQQLGVLRDYYFPIGIEAERTYEMVLTTGKVETVVKPSLTRQFLVFTINPPDALLTVDDEPWPVIDGTAEKLVSFGKHEYRVEASDYHPTAGKIEVNDPDQKVVQNVTLRPNFGFLKIEGNMALLRQSSIYVDNANGAEALREPMRLKSGKHIVRIMHQKYKPLEQQVEIIDNETYTLNAVLNANYLTVTLQVDAPAEIFIDGEKKGVGTWTGDVTLGRHLVECRQEGCRPFAEEMLFNETLAGQTLTLQAPTILSGSLSVSSTPSFAILYLDGVRQGETPMLVSTLQIGKHTIKLVKEGYEPLVKSITIGEDEILELKETLTAMPEEPKNKHKEKKPTSSEKTSTDAKPHHLFATANAAISMTGQPSYGFSVGTLNNKLGWFVTAMSNFNFHALGYWGVADADGLVDGERPNYDGTSCTTRLSVMGGVTYHLVGPLYARAGMGYGLQVLSCGTKQYDLVKWSANSASGLDATGGLQLKFNRITTTLDAVTTGFKTLELKAGIGVCF